MGGASEPGAIPRLTMLCEGLPVRVGEPAGPGTERRVEQQVPLAGMRRTRGAARRVHPEQPRAPGEGAEHDLAAVARPRRHVAGVEMERPQKLLPHQEPRAIRRGEVPC